MFGFFNSAMSSATQRFLSYELGKGDYVQLRKTFNATQVIHIGIALLIFLLAETIGLWFVRNYLVIPPERMNAAIWVYHFSILSFMVTIIQVPYNATILAHERMDIYAYVSILEVVLKLLIVFMLTWITFDKLHLYAILYFFVVFVIASIYRIFTKKNFKESKFELVRDKNLYKTLVNFSGWSMFGGIAYASKVQGVSIILNIFFGPTVNAARGIANQVQGAVNNFVYNFQMAVNPQIVKSYASNEKEFMTSLIIRSSKFSFYLLFIIALPIIAEVDQVLMLWLKLVPDYASTFTVLSIVIILITSASSPLNIAIQATGRIAVYQAVIGILLICILPISYALFKAGYPPMITYYATVLIEIIVLFFRLFFLKRMIQFPVMLFIKEVVLKNIAIILISLSLPFLLLDLMTENLMRLFVMVFATLIWSTTIIYFIGLNKLEKNMVIKLVKLSFKKLKI